MPYNTSAIPPRVEPTGSAQLPLARVKKIVNVDPDIAMCSNNAAFVITLATELFIQQLSESAHTIVRSERKPRKNVQYRDVANAVSRNDSLEFLSDIIPRTVQYKEVKARAAQAGAGPSIANVSGAGALVEQGQTTLSLGVNGAGSGSSEIKDRMNAITFGGGDGAGDGILSPAVGIGASSSLGENGGEEDADPSAQLQAEMGGVRSRMPDVLANGHANGGEDVEMS